MKIEEIYSSFAGRRIDSVCRYAINNVGYLFSILEYCCTISNRLFGNKTRCTLHDIKPFLLAYLQAGTYVESARARGTRNRAVLAISRRLHLRIS